MASPTFGAAESSNQREPTTHRRDPDPTLVIAGLVLA
jgi:hypothetical protein